MKGPLTATAGRKVAHCTTLLHPSPPDIFCIVLLQAVMTEKVRPQGAAPGGMNSNGMPSGMTM